MSQVSVILLNWNGEGYLAECLDSVLAQDYEDMEIIVIDNASSDGSVRLLKDRYIEEIQLIENDMNIGFSRGMNMGFAVASGKYVMPLNFDIIMEPGFISAMVNALEMDIRRGSVTGKLLKLNEQGRTNVIDSTGHIIFKNRYVMNRGEGETDSGQLDQQDLVFGATGAAPLYRREMLDDIAWQGEYYDESFFIMLEDVDLDWRAQLKGWQCAYTPQAVAYHYRTASKVSKSRLIQRHYYKNRYLVMWKNDFFISWLKCLPQIFLMDLSLGLDIMFTRPIALLMAWGDLVRLLPLMLRKRHAIQTNRKASRSDIEVWFKEYDWQNDLRRKLRLSYK